MAEKTCPRCRESVDEAKAFCPACGYSFLEEQKRTDTSAYEQADHTMQMGQTMYNSMLSDMGLNLKKEPEKRVEILKPVAGQPAQNPQPVAPPAASTPSQPAEPATQEKKSNKNIWVITIVVALVLLLIFVVAVVAIGLYLYFKSGRF